MLKTLKEYVDQLRSLVGAYAILHQRHVDELEQLQRLHKLEYVQRMLPLERAVVGLSVLGPDGCWRHVWGAVVRVPLHSRKELKCQIRFAGKHRLAIEGTTWIELEHVYCGSTIVVSNALAIEFDAATGDFLKIDVRNLLEIPQLGTLGSDFT